MTYFYLTVIVFGLDMNMSTARCLKLLTKVPLAPLMVTVRALTLASTPSGTSTDCFTFKIFMVYL